MQTSFQTCSLHCHCFLFRFIQMAPQYFFCNLPASESKDVLQRLLNQEATRCHEEEPPLERETHDRCIIQWPSDPRWAPLWGANYKHGQSLALYCAQELVICSRTLCFSPSVILSLCFIRILFWLIWSLHFKSTSLNQRFAISFFSSLIKGAAWLLKCWCLLGFFHFFLIFAPSFSSLDKKGLGTHKEKKNVTQGNLWKTCQVNANTV